MGFTKDPGLPWVLHAGVHANAEVREIIRFGPPGDRFLSAAPGCIAIELIRSYGMAVGASVFDTCIEIGRFVEVASREEIPVDLMPRQQAKLELCGSPRAKDTNIRQALVDLFGGPGADKKGGRLAGVKSHAWAALAIAVTTARVHGWMQR